MGKSALKNRKAQEAQKLQKLEHALRAKSSLFKNPVKVFIALRDETISSKSLPNDSFYCNIKLIILNRLTRKKERMTFYKIVICIAKTRAKRLLEDEDSLTVLSLVAKYYHRKIRSINDWVPKTHNRDRLVSDLLRFVFTDYDVPNFMDQAFYEEDPTYINWFLLIGQGGNIRMASRLPLPLTKKMAHHFLHAPNSFTILEALRYGQVKNLGGNQRLIAYINGTRLGQLFDHNEFWESVIRFFIKHPMLDPAQIQPIVDYIQYVKFGAERLIQPETGEIIQDAAPEKPNFSMKGRTVESLLRDVEKWHKGLNKLKVNAEWDRVNTNDFIYEEGKEHNKKIYHINQLINSTELKVEGRHMKHCVASYINSCVNGRCSIWSMNVKFETTGEVQRLVTIELSRQRTIVQVRGKYNAMPNKKTVDIITKWMNKEGLRISKWAI